MKALWNRNTLQRMGVSSYSSKPVPHPALLNRKGFKFMLCGHHIFYGRHGAVSYPCVCKANLEVLM